MCRSAVPNVTKLGQSMWDAGRRTAIRWRPLAERDRQWLHCHTGTCCTTFCKQVTDCNTDLDENTTDRLVADPAVRTDWRSWWQYISVFLLSKENLKRTAVLEAGPAAETCSLEMTKLRWRMETEMAKWRLGVTSLSADRNIYYETRNLLTECHDKTYYVCWLSIVMSSCLHRDCGQVKCCILATDTLANWFRLGSNQRRTGKLVVW
jgi:hypothetical protein